MVAPDSAALRRRLRRTIILCAICVSASALGMLLARPVAAHFQSASPWVLPALGIAVLVILAATVLLILPRAPK